MAVWSVVKQSALATGLRLDAEYYQPSYLVAAARLDEASPQSMGSFTFVTDGIHESPDEVETGGIRYLSAKCVKDNTFALSDALQISQAQHAANPRTSLNEDDVLITTVGTIGNAAVVQRNILPANADRHLGIIRVNPDSGVDPYYLSAFLNCAYGRFQSLREATGNVQLNLFIEKIKELHIPSLACADDVARQVRAAYAIRRESNACIANAEKLLADALGLSSLDTTPEKCYSRHFRELGAEQRMDAEYFSPKFQSIIAKLREGGRTLADVVTLSERYFDASAKAKSPMFRYIEIGSLTEDGEAEAETVQTADAPSRATWLVKPCDIITSTVRPIRRLSAMIRQDQDGSVCSSGFAVLTPKQGNDGLEPEVVLTFLRLPVICEILDLHTTASMYPAISVQRLMGIPIIIPKERVRQQIISKVKEGVSLRRESSRLLDGAKSMIEDSILMDTVTEG